MIRLVLLAIAFLLAGCGHMPVTSMIRLARADLAATDPAQLRAAVKLPRVLKLKPAGVALRIGVKLTNGEEDTQDFVLRARSLTRLTLWRCMPSSSPIRRSSPIALIPPKPVGSRRFATR